MAGASCVENSVGVGSDGRAEGFVPTPHPDHLLQIGHFRRSLPFEEFENPWRKLGRSPADLESDREFINFVMNGLVRSEILEQRQLIESDGGSFRWLGGSEGWLSQWRKPYPTDFMPVHYPAGSCVHAKSQTEVVVKEGLAIRQDHQLDCWSIDFEGRRVLDDRVLFYQSYVPERGARPSASFDADAARLFRSLRPPD